MPEFQLNGAVPSDDFAAGYIESMFFTNCDCGDEREDLANQLGTGRLTLASRAAIARDCERFQRDNADLLQEAYDTGDYDAAQAGRDLWFTRQGHGVGYWDRAALKPQCEEWQETQIPLDQWTPEIHATRDRLQAKSIGERLTEAAEAMGESYPEIYRGWIYVR